MCAGVTTSLQGLQSPPPSPFVPPAPNTDGQPWQCVCCCGRWERQVKGWISNEEFDCWINNMLWSTAELFPPDQHLQTLLPAALTSNFPDTHTHRKKKPPVNLWQLTRREKPTGNMSTETITFETTKFNYSLSSLWSSPLPLIEALTCGLTETRLQ